MKPFNLMEYIRKFRFIIVGSLLVSGIIAFLALNYIQTYTASAIIRYSNSGAKEGLAPDGTEIDVSEIYSAEVLNQVFENLDLDYSKHNIDDLRSRVTVEPVRTQGEAALEEAKTSLGEEMEEMPVEYVVSFTAATRDSGDKETFARTFLDEMLDVYVQSYGKSHINRGSAVNDISKLKEQDYDYLEMAEILKNSISTTLTGLVEKAQEESDFRSAQTGYSFDDLKREFELLYEIETSNIFSYILENRVTKDRESLIAKYENRINDYLLSNTVSQEQIQSINEVISSYVGMMRESGNTDITFEYILDDVHDSYYTDENEETQRVDQTVEYDELLDSYISARSSYESALIDIAYCRYIIEIYNGMPSEQMQITEQSVADGSGVQILPGAVPEPVNAGAVDETAQSMIDSLAEKLNGLYEVLDETNREYNEYAGAQNINLVSGIAVAPAFSLPLYAGLIMAVFGVVGCMGAVVIGRLGDIFEYCIYYDRAMEIPNRAACDRYISANASKFLSDEFVCISIRVPDIQKKNQESGRNETDQMLKALAKILRDTFSGEEECFLGLNGVGQYIIFAGHMGAERAEYYLEHIGQKVREYNREHRCRIEYTAGVAEAKKLEIYQLKPLMLKAISSSFSPNSEQNLHRTEEKRDAGEHIKAEEVTQDNTDTEKVSESGRAEVERHLEKLKRMLDNVS